jgi:fumarate reductase flavoprotein subunit
MECDGIPHAGDGLKMATQLGAATEGLGGMVASAPCVPNTVFVMLGTPPDQVRVGLKGLGGEPHSIWVNKRGLRFTDECITFYHYEAQNAFAQQPDKIAYSIYDSQMMQAMIDEGRGLMMGMPGMGAPEGASGKKVKMPELVKALQQPVNNKVWVKVSDSWDEIARWIGADPEVLKATIDEYNTACDQGHDPIFAKDRQYLLPLRTPPYFAVEGHITYVNTIGGIKINEHMQVLDKQDTPIPGLYAAGVDTGGWESETYCSRISGHAFSFAINSGRIAGESVAQFISGK